MLMFHEANHRLVINPVKPMTVINYLVFIRARGAIQPHIFVASFFIMFYGAVSTFHPATVRLVFLRVVVVFRIIRR